MKIGPVRYHPDLLQIKNPIEWVTTIKILGVIFSPIKQQMIELNYRNLL